MQTKKEKIKMMKPRYAVSVSLTEEEKIKLEYVKKIAKLSLHEIFMLGIQSATTTIKKS
jgi:hypothetical protein